VISRPRTDLTRRQLPKFSTKRRAGASTQVSWNLGSARTRGIVYLRYVTFSMSRSDDRRTHPSHSSGTVGHVQPLFGGARAAEQARSASRIGLGRHVPTSASSRRRTSVLGIRRQPHSHTRQEVAASWPLGFASARKNQQGNRQRDHSRTAWQQRRDARCGFEPGRPMASPRGQSSDHAAERRRGVPGNARFDSLGASLGLPLHVHLRHRRDGQGVHRRAGRRSASRLRCQGPRRRAGCDVLVPASDRPTQGGGRTCSLVPSYVEGHPHQPS